MTQTSPEQLKDQAKKHLASIISQHVGKNVRTYKWSTLLGHGGTNLYGMSVDHKPFTGKVVDVTSPWVVVKDAPTHFVMVHEALLRELPEVGTKVTVTPYARRKFDGTRLDAPEIEHRVDSDGKPYQVTKFTIGVGTTHLPVKGPDGSYVATLIDQIEQMKAPDGVRTISQLLVDAKANNFAVYEDPNPENVVAIPPTLRFEVDTAKYRGPVEIFYDRVLDYYGIRTTNETRKDLSFEDLGPCLEDLVDDGEWRFAHVDYETPAPRNRRRMAA